MGKSKSAPRREQKKKPKEGKTGKTPFMSPGLPTNKPAKQQVVEKKPMVGRSGRMVPPPSYEVG